MKNEILTKVGNIVSKTNFKIKKYSPEILMGLGIVGTVASTVLACKATTKVGGIINDRNKQINDVHVCLDDETVEYTADDSKKDLTIIYTQSIFKLIKLYTPATVLGVLSITSIISSHNILKKRNLALAAAYAAIDKGFKKYRSNVVERFGEEVDKELRYNIKKKEIEKKVVDKNGKEKTKKETIYEIDTNQNNVSEYARFFDEWNSPNHTKDPEYNLMFLRRQQDYANELLKARGHLFLNEVYDLLDIPRSKAGQVVGWIYDKDNKVGDNYVDFGIYSINREANRRFVNGQEYSILLDFNVDGVIYDKI